MRRRGLIWVLRGFLLIPAIFLLLVLHYTLPQTDIVRIVNTEVQRIDVGGNSIFWAGPDSGSANRPDRDVRFIETFRPDGEPMVYRNQDTSWGWPFYFKFDSSNLQAEARDAISTAAAPEWVAMRHYGWRSEWFSIFPNATSLRPVDGPDATLIPWFNIVFLTLLAALVWGVGVRIRRWIIGRSETA
ncbi:MAG: DUF1523 family protein [Pseudomonadota bacterium]